MGVVVDTTGREYWQALLGAGGFTAVPRWTRDPTPGVAEHQEPIPEEVAAALYRLASSAALPLSSLLLAAHAKVLAALSGEVTVNDRLPGGGRAAVAVPAEYGAGHLADSAGACPGG